MKYNYIYRLFTAVISFVLFFSCGVEEYDGVNSSITTKVSHIAVEGETISFTLSADRAKSFEYCVAKSGEDVSMTELEGGDEVDVTVDNLEVGAEYTLTVNNTNQFGQEMEAVSTQFVAGEPYKRVLVYKFTGTWCVNCPEMTAVIDNASMENPDRLVVVALHLNDKVTTREAEQFSTDWGIMALPTAYVDYCDMGPSTQSSILLNKAITSSVNRGSKSSVSIDSETNGSDASIKVTTKVEDRDAEYKLAVIITEGNLNLGEVGSRDGVYHHVTRKFLTDIHGEVLESFDAEGQVESQFNITLDEAWNSENIEVVAVILKKSANGDYIVDNTIESKL